MRRLLLIGIIMLLLHSNASAEEMGQPGDIVQSVERNANDGMAQNIKVSARESMVKRKTPEDDMLGEDEAAERENFNWMGTWMRQALYINGALEHQTPGTLVYEKDTFHATAQGYSTSGTIEVIDNTIKTVMLQSNCPGGVKAPMTIVYTYEISEDGKQLTLHVGPVTEVYRRS